MLAKVGPQALGGKCDDQGQRGRGKRQIHEIDRTTEKKERQQSKYCT
jgi:hypothetical protein